MLNSQYSPEKKIVSVVNRHYSKVSNEAPGDESHDLGESNQSLTLMQQLMMSHKNNNDEELKQFVEEDTIEMKFCRRQPSTQTAPNNGKRMSKSNPRATSNGGSVSNNMGENIATNA